MNANGMKGDKDRRAGEAETDKEQKRTESGGRKRRMEKEKERERDRERERDQRADPESGENIRPHQYVRPQSPSAACHIQRGDEAGAAEVWN